MDWALSTKGIQNLTYTKHREDGNFDTPGLSSYILTYTKHREDGNFDTPGVSSYILTYTKHREDGNFDTPGLPPGGLGGRGV